MKLKTALLLFVFLPLLGNAQLKHYFSYNASFFSFSNHDYIENKQFISLPLNGSYKTEKEKFGIEAHFQRTKKMFKDVPIDRFTPGEINYLYNRNIELLFHYKILDNKKITLSPMLGIVYNSFSVYSNSFLCIMPGESRFGHQVGLNTNTPIYKGLYFNNSIRYNIFHKADYNKKTLIVEMGLGYVLSRNVSSNDKSKILQPNKDKLKHYLSYNLVYANFFNSEKELSHIFKPLLNLNGSYKIEKSKFGLEAHFNSTFRKYEEVFNGKTQTEDLILYSRQIDLLFHYKLIENTYFSIHPLAGISKNKTSWKVDRYWFDGEYINSRNFENLNYGFQVGLNAIAPIYKGLYANSNVRFNSYPTARDYNKSLMVEVGLGYVFSRKSKVE